MERKPAQRSSGKASCKPLKILSVKVSQAQPPKRGPLDEKAQTGYVLQSDYNWTTILTKARDVHTLPTSDVESRQVCSSNNPGTFAFTIQNGGIHNGADC